MPVQEPKKSLRIGIFRGKQRLEESVVKKRRTVSVGQDESNTFCVLSSAVPKKWNLFIYDSAKDSFTLCLKKSMRGRVVLKNNVSITLDENITEGQGVKFVGDTIQIPLTNTARGRVAIGKINILFQFVSSHDAAAAGRLLYEPATPWEKIAEFFPRALVYGLIFSLLAHLIPLIYVGVQDWPVNDDIFLTPSYMKVVKIEDMQIQDEEDEENEPEIVEESDDVLPEVQVDNEPAPEPGTISKAELMD